MVFQKRIIFRLFALCFFPILSNAQSWQTKVNPSVFDELRARQTTEILVTMREQADLSRVSNGLTKEEKGELVVQILRGTAERSQSDMQQFLQTQNVDFQSFWLINAVFLKSDFALLKQLAERSDVATIDNNPHTQQSLLPQNLNLPQPEGVNIPWGILKIKADSVWALGIRGQGAVVGGADTGYDWTHPALKKKYRGWNDTTGVANHNYNWHDAIHPDSTTATNPCGTNQNKPCDDGFHGTHTMGTMIGSVDTQLIGVAPGARWIGTRNMDRGDGTPARYIECFQWFVAPTDSLGRLPQTKLAPHVINNSWGCPPSEGCNLGNFAVMNTVIQNVRKAGIVVVASAGNSGPNCGSVQDPPAMFAPSFSVGATGQNDTIASLDRKSVV